MKTVLAILAILIILGGSFNSCTKSTVYNVYTDTVILPINPSIVGTTTIVGDTTVIDINGIKVHYYSTSPCAPSIEIFNFWVTAPSLPANTTLNWYYGDGNQDMGTKLGSIASHMYNSGGKRTMVLQVSINGTITTTIATTILAWGQNVTPTASFYSSLNNVEDPNWVAFNSTSNVSSGAIVSYQWDFNDGRNDTTSMAYHEHYFPNVPQDKTYKVKLTAVSQAGCKGSITQDVTVPASYNLPCSFTYTNQSWCKPNVEQTYFVADNTGVPNGVKYYWDFSDGIVDSTRNYTINHRFIYQGTKAVVLKIKLNGRTLCNAQYPVTVHGSTATPSAFISQVQRQGVNDFFFNSSCTASDSYTVKQYNWDFGDGNVDNSNNPTAAHVYSQSGTYTVSVKATIIESGCSDTCTKQVVVY
jgi:large repetitive protein